MAAIYRIRISNRASIFDYLSYIELLPTRFSLTILVRNKIMSIARGALIVFEGCDKAGKSTQIKMLIEALKKLNIPAEARAFPNRSTAIGTILHNHLSKKELLTPECAHLLFSANRWECKDDILNSLHNGVTLIVDRYAGSGAAYTATISGKSLNWCKETDRGLPAPDLVILFKVNEDVQSARTGWGNEIYEDSKFQKQVALNYEKLIEETWSIIDANQEKLVIHSQILEQVLHVIKNVKDSAVGELYVSQT